MHKFSSNKPIYLQLMDIIKQQIATGQLGENEKVKSVRDLAIEFGVNPNTAQKALSELEREGLIFTERTSGRFVALPAKRIKEHRAELVGAKTDEYLSWMRDLKYSDTEIKNLINKALQKEEKKNG